MEKKVDKYSIRITYKTEKTLTKLFKWQDKVHQLLEKINSEATQSLFGNNQLTFAIALDKYKKVEVMVHST